MHDGGFTPFEPVIVGRRVFLSDGGRLWASPVVPFTSAETDVIVSAAIA
ncbi:MULTISPECIES: hypothetical protein [unclassified Streptosporangium]|nr:MULTISPECIES: hypothetical protein [unclassified Streptosporangium]